MKRFLFSFLLLLFFGLSKSQKIWDGGGDGVSWSDGNNWSSNTVPIASDNVLLDNSNVLVTYTVNLPSTPTTISVNSLTITPASGSTIQLTIPIANTANPGLNVTGSGDALVLNDRSVLMNSTGVGAGGIGLAITNSFRINNGAKYVHNNIRGNAAIVAQLSMAVGTETGIFEFDVPGTAGYAVSLNNRTFGTLIFSAVAARTYTGNGTLDLSVRGDLIVNANATLSSTMTANINIAGNLTLTGNFDNNPSAGATNRSIILNGTSPQTISGSGGFSFGPNFRNIEVSPASSVTLQRGINLSNAGNSLMVNTGGVLQMGANVISGAGSFQLISAGWIGIGSPDGITAPPTLSGNIQTFNRSYAPGATYEYNATTPQVTGDGLPTIITGALRINNSSPLYSLGVTLSVSTDIPGPGSLYLELGKLRTATASLLTIDAGGLISTYGPNSFIGGPLRVIGHSGFTYPIGINAATEPTGTIYAPITMNHFGGSPLPGDTYIAEYIRSNPYTDIGPAVSDSINHISYVEYWSYFRTDGGTNVSTKQIILEVNPSSFCHHIDSTLVARYDTASSTWKSHGLASFYKDPMSTPPLEWGHVNSQPNVTSFGYFTLSTILPFAANPLPINLIAFDATKLSNTKSSVNWELAACCSPTATFDIQRADAERRFTTIGSVAGSATHTIYSYTDYGLKSGINYYRLKMTDADGAVSYSRTVVIMNGVKGVVLTSLIPTIATHSAVLTIGSSIPQKIEIVIVDMQGKIVQKTNHALIAGNTTIVIDFSRFRAGVYQVAGITAEGKTNTIRFFKK